MGRVGGGWFLPEDACTKNGRPDIDVLQENHPETRVSLGVGGLIDMNLRSM